MKKYCLLFFLLISTVVFAKNRVEDYQRLFLPVYTAKGDLRIALRLFKMNGIPSFLTVNPSNYQTEVTAVANLSPRSPLTKKNPGYFSKWLVQSTRYYQLLNKTTSPPYLLENQGLTHIDNLENGNVLTIDLCPSTKSFEAEFFQDLVQRSVLKKKPTPIVIAISGMWILGHPEEFDWLIHQVQQKKLDITWANHSFSHVYYKDLPYVHNFLLSTATNMDVEIMQTEKYLLEEGQLPSVFYRFPGLVANKKLIKTIRNYGLIPLGTDAWIAALQQKNQQLTPGGIILVHGNHNEHKGITLLRPLLDKLELVDIKQGLLL